MVRGRVPIATARGIDDPENPIWVLMPWRCRPAIEQVYSDDGVVVLMDLGSALAKGAELALEFAGPGAATNVFLCAAPLVGGGPWLRWCRLRLAAARVLARRKAPWPNEGGPVGFVSCRCGGKPGRGNLPPSPHPSRKSHHSANSQPAGCTPARQPCLSPRPASSGAKSSVHRRGSRPTHKHQPVWLPWGRARG